MSALSSALTGFERFWNSSFGLPQQLIFRALRVAQGDASFFGERGFGDASLIPILGALDAEREDVDAREMVQQMNKIPGVNLDEDGFAAQLGVGIVTDPLSFLTSGLTAGGKAAASLSKGLRHARIGTEAEALALGKQGLATKLDEVLAAPPGSIGGKQRRMVKKARKALDDIEGDDLLSAMKETAKREQLIAAPIIGALGPKKRVSDNYRSWFQLLRDKSGANTAAAWIASGPLQGVPAIRQITGAIAGTAAGVRYAGHAARAIKLNEAAAKGELPELADFLNGTSTLAEKLGTATTARQTADGIITAAQSGDARRFASKVLGRARMKGIYDEAGVQSALDEALERLGVESMDEVTPAALEEFTRRHEVSAARLDELSSRFDFTKKFEEAEEVRKLGKGADLGFRLGRKIEMGRRKMFVSDAAAAKEFDEAVKDIRSLNARNTQRIAALAEEGAKLTKIDAEALGMSVEDTEALQRAILEMDTMDQELLSIAENPFNTGARIESFVLRLDSSVKLLAQRLAPLAGKSSDEVAEMAEHLVRSRGLGLFDGLQFEGTFSGPAKLKRVDPAKAPGGVKHNRHVVTAGSYEGRYLGHLTDRQLRKVRSRLESKARRKLTEDEVRLRVQRDPELVGAAKSLEVTPEEMVELARRRGTKGFPRLKRLELDEMERNMAGFAANGVYRSLKFKDKAALVTRLLKGGKVRKDLADAARELKPLITLLRSKNFKDVDDVMDLLTLARGKRIQRLAPGVQLNELARPLLNLANKTVRQLDQPIFDKRLLSKGELKDYNEASSLYELRKADVKPEPRVSASRTTTTEHAPARDLEGVAAKIDVDGETIPVEMSPLVETMGRIMVMRKELERVARRTGNPSPALLAELATETGRLSSQVVDPIKAALRAAGAGRSFEFLDGIRKEILIEATESGVMGPDSPLAYLGRIYSRDELQALDNILGKTEVVNAIDSALPKMSSMFRRSADAMSLEELNQVHQAVVDAGHTQTADLLKTRMEAMGLRPGRYEEAPLTALLTRLGQAQQRQTGASVVQDMLDVAAKEGTVVGGKVVRVVTRAGTAREGQVKRVAGRKGVKRADDETVEIVDRPVEQPITAVVIEDHTGREISIPAEEFGLRVSGMKLGKLDYEEGGKAVHKAFGRRSGQGGRINEAEQFGVGGPLDRATLESLNGEYVILGEQNSWRGMFDGFAKQWDEGPAALLAADGAISLMKRFQTTFRPVFHMMNVLGAYPMAMTAGATPKSLALGTATTMRFLSGGQDKARWYERYSTLMGDGKVGIRDRFTGGAATTTVRRSGPGGIRTTEEAAEAAGVTAEDLLFHTADGGVEDLGETLDAWERHNLFTGFTAEGLRGASTAPERLRLVRESMINPKAPGAILRKGLDSISDTTEGSENFARMMTYFSLRHAGQSADEAARNTLMAMVPYHDLTRFERVAMKRAFTYYSFPRHYTGQAFRYFANRPDVASRYAHAITAEGGVVERDGRLVVDTKAGRLNVGRLDPNLEALGVLKAFGEVFTNTAAALGHDEAAAIVREQEATGRKTPFPIEPGAPATILANLAQADVGGAITEAGEAFWISRYFMDEGDPLKETSPLTKLEESLFNPFKELRPEHTRRVVVARYNQLKRTLQRKLQTHENDPDLVRLYTEELNRVEKALTAQLEGK